MQYQGKQLDFISWIKRDGSGTVPCNVGKWDKSNKTPKLDNMEYLNEELFQLSRLSITEDTYIASGFNSFVVKLKK